MAASTTLTPEQRRDRARTANLAGAVKTVIRRWDNLTPEQREALRALADRS